MKYGISGPSVDVDPWALLKRWLQLDYQNHKGDTLLLLVKDTEAALNFACAVVPPKMSKREAFVMAAMQSPSVADSIKAAESLTSAKMDRVQRAEWYVREAATTLAAMEADHGK